MEQEEEKKRIGSTLINANHTKTCCEGCVLAWCLRKEVCCFISLTIYLFVICFAFCKISFCFCKHSPALFSHWLQQVDSFLYCVWKYITFFLGVLMNLGSIKGSEESELKMTCTIQPHSPGIPWQAGWCLICCPKLLPASPNTVCN